MFEGFEVIEEYQRVEEFLQGDSQFLFVAGKAGTGKSTLIDYLQESLSHAVNMVVVAPTGVAALNVQGATIHSFFCFPTNIASEVSHYHMPRKKREVLENTDVLIIDEVSMVRGDLMDNIDRALRRNLRVDLPFGGLKIILVGDLYQLPPVVSERDMTVLLLMGYSPECYFFDAQSLQDTQVEMVELSRVFRQRNSGFMKLLNAFRDASIPRDVLEKANSFWVRPKSDSSIILTGRRDVARRINEEELEKIPSREWVYEGRIEGDFENSGVGFPVSPILKLKVGAHVMFVKNDDEKRWVNGTQGIVVSCKKDVVCVEVGDSVFEVEEAKWESYDYEVTEDEGKRRVKAVVTGRYFQIPLIPAWAITVHKAQGKTLDNVHIDFEGGVFAAGQVYVALSRCRSAKDISLAFPLGMQDFWCNDPVNTFFHLMRSRSDLGMPRVPRKKCPKCGSPMNVKKGGRNRFLGCVKYPDCKGTISL